MKKILLSALLVVGMSVASHAEFRGVDIVTMTVDGIANGFSPGEQWLVGVRLSSNPSYATVRFQTPSISTTSNLYLSSHPASDVWRVYHATASDSPSIGNNGTYETYDYPKYFPRGLKLLADTSAFNLITIEVIKSGDTKLPPQ